MQNEQNQNPAIPENNGLNKAARHNARRYTLQAMYQWQLTGAPIIDIETEFLQYQIDKKIDLEYFKELLYGIPKNLTEIDGAMEPFLSRPIAELDQIELAVLRIAIYELMKRPDVPYRVVINEALELTKKFGSVEGFKFVNGVLDRVARKLRATEINMKK